MTAQNVLDESVRVSRLGKANVRQLSKLDSNLFKHLNTTDSRDSLESVVAGTPDYSVSRSRDSSLNSQLPAITRIPIVIHDQSNLSRVLRNKVNVGKGGITKLLHQKRDLRAILNRKH